MTDLVMGIDAVRLKAAAMLYDVLAKQTLELFTAGGKVLYNFGDSAPGLADALVRFYVEHNRAPHLLFNNGAPPSLAAALKANGAGNDVLTFATVTKVSDVFDPNEGSYPQTTHVIPLLCVRCYIPPPGVTGYVMRYAEGGDWQLPVTLEGAYPSRFATGCIDPVPIDAIQGGACNNWQVMLLAKTHPEFIIATDEGFVLTRDGVLCVEASCSYWVEKYIPHSIYANAWLFPGIEPLYGFPVAILEQLRKMREASFGDSPLDFIKDIAQIAITFIGFYFSVAGLAGLVNGAFTIPNIGSALSVADKFGVETSKLGAVLNIVSLTPDGIFGNTPGIGGDVALGDFETGDWGPSLDEAWGEIDLGVSVEDFGPSLDEAWGAYDPFAGMDFGTAQAAVTGDYSATEVVNMDSNSGAIRLGGREIYTAADVQAWDAMRATVPPAVAQQVVRDTIQQKAAAAGISMSLGDITKAAGDVLKLAGSFYTIKAQAAQLAARGAILSNGAIMGTLANGTRTIQYPNGQVVTIPATGTVPGTSLIPGIPNQYLYIGGAVLAGVMVLSSMRR